MPMPGHGVVFLPHLLNAFKCRGRPGPAKACGDRSLVVDPDLPRSRAVAWFTPLRAWMVSAVVVGLVGAWLGQQGPAPGSDDWAQYLLHAEALAEGRPYADIDYVFSHYAWGTGPPIAAPGLPLTFAPVLALTPFRHWMHAGFNIVTLLVLMAIMGAYFGRHHPVRAASAALLTAMAIILARGADTLHPDVAFVTLIWGALLLIDSQEHWTWTRTVGIALLGLWAILYRVAALPLIPAMALFGVMAWKAHRFKPWLITAVWAGAAAYLTFVVESGQIPSPASYIEIPQDDAITPSRWGVMLKEAFEYRLGVFQLELYPFAQGTLNDVYHALVTPLVLLGVLMWMEGTWFRYAVIFSAAYVAMLLLVPFGISRYMWPLWPVAAFGLVTGVDAALDRIPMRWLPKNGFRSAAFVVAVVGVALVTTGIHSVEPSVNSLDTVQEVVSFAQGLPPEDDPRFVFYLPRSFAWTANLPTMALIATPSNEAAIRELEEKRITHVVVGILGDPVHIASLERWTSVIVSHPERFTMLLENQDFAVYAVTPAPESTAN